MKQNTNKTRFDARIPIEQKELLERAAVLGGYRSLTEFILTTANEKAKSIIRESEQVIASERDSEIFFDALMNPGEPNEKLVNTANKYRENVRNSTIKSDA